MYDTVYYWTGGSEYGRWNRTLGYNEQMVADIRRQGYVAHPGKLSIGAPEGPPTRKQFEQVGM